MQLTGRKDGLKRAFPETVTTRAVFLCSMCEEGREDSNRAVRSRHSPHEGRKKRKYFFSESYTDNKDRTQLRKQK